MNAKLSILDELSNIYTSKKLRLPYAWWKVRCAWRQRVYL
jgi:hypothetical protein